jgi:hypothetical protein
MACASQSSLQVSKTVKRPEVIEQVQQIIVVLRGHRVVLDADLATLYGVENRALLQAVKRNLERFPADFMFQLTREEALRLRSQTVILNAQVGENIMKSDGSTDARGKHVKYLPYAFTEQGVAMLSSVLRSPRAIEVNIEIMRAFVQLRQMLAEHADLARKLETLEKRYNAQFGVVFDAGRSQARQTWARRRQPLSLSSPLGLPSCNPRQPTSQKLLGRLRATPGAKRRDQVLSSSDRPPDRRTIDP